MARSLVVKLTYGATAADAGPDLERVNQAFTVAAAGVALGAGVSLWLTGDAVWLAVPGRVDDLGLPLATPLADLRATVLDGGLITVCSQCAARRDLVEADLLPGRAGGRRSGLRRGGAAARGAGARLLTRSGSRAALKTTAL